MKLIGLAGLARSGKDTIAAVMAEQRRVRKYALADPVRETAAAMFGLPLEIFSGENPDREKVNEFWGFSPRRMLQLVGTECGREILRADIWTKRAEQQLEACHRLNSYSEVPEEYFIVTDIRFEDEAGWIRKNGGVVIHITRDTEFKVADHTSEKGVPIQAGDLGITNEGTLEELRDSIGKIFVAMEKDNG